MNAYITDLAAFLPNSPVENDDVETVLGMVSQTPSRTRKIILRNNRIKTRHYAIDPKTGLRTHSNAELAAEAVMKLRGGDPNLLSSIQCLCCGTASPDQIAPGHASMVHGELGCPTCEVVSTSGICVSGMTAMKYAYLNVLAGQVDTAVATGSELSSSYTCSRYCRRPEVNEDHAKALEKSPIIGFDADFLRWMLSDGAGAALIQSKPDPTGISLKIDWIEILSFADQLDTCMYAGAVKNEDGTLTSWRDFDPEEAIANEALLLKQDVRLLNAEVVRASVDLTLPFLVEKYGLTSDDYDYFLPHYSSEYFRQRIYDRMVAIDFEIPFEKWYTNLQTKGNTGAASIYIILEELFHSGQLRKGQTLLCFIPESGRFSMCYMQLTVV